MVKLEGELRIALEKGKPEDGPVEVEAPAVAPEPTASGIVTEAMPEEESAVEGLLADG